MDPIENRKGERFQRGRYEEAIEVFDKNASKSVIITAAIGAAIGAYLFAVFDTLWVFLIGPVIAFGLRKYMAFAWSRQKEFEAKKEIVSLFEKGLHLYEDGEYNDAIDTLVQVFERVERKFGEKHPAYADIMNIVASIYRDMGDYTKAEPICQKALEIRRKVRGENHSDYAESLNTLASIYRDMGDYTKAEPICQKALEIRRKVRGENHSDYAESLNTLASIYRDMGDYTKAEPICQKALEIRQQDPYVHSKAWLGKLSGDTLYGIPLGKNTLWENHSDYAESLNTLAALYHEMGDYTKAEPLYQKALEIRRKVLGENHSDYAESLNNLAALYVSTSRQTHALKLLRESVSVEDKVVDQIFSIASDRQRMAFIKRLQITLHVFLSLVSQELSQDQSARRDAVDLVMRRKSIAAEALNIQREMILTGKYPQLKSTLLELNNIRREISLKSLAGPTRREKLDKYKQQLEELNSKKERLETKLVHDIPEIQIQQSLKMINSRIICNTLLEGTALVEFVRFNNYNFNAIPANGDSQWHSPRYLAFIFRSNQPENVQMIDLGEAEYIDKTVTLFRSAIIQGHDRNLVALDTSDSLSSYPYQDRNNNSVIWRDIGYGLYHLIFHPLLPAIGDCKKLFIAPDGDLSRLPFEVLPTRQDDSETELLIDDHSIVYVTTGRDILQINNVLDGLSNESIVASDPDFDLDSNRTTISSTIANNMPNFLSPKLSHRAAQIPPREDVTTRPISDRISRDFDRSTIIFSRLEGTREEGQEISKLLGVQPLVSENVLESKLKSYRSPKILHIATHGFFLANQDVNKEKDSIIIGAKDHPRRGAGGANVLNRLSGQRLENPMLRSGLALAGANTWVKYKPMRKEAEDGILTAEDVSTMDLRNTELVVLSACETGLGQVQTGEGVFGLRRSFVLAGAKTLVMSLWKVPDEQTKDLMIDFYKRLLSGKRRAEALREAQLAMKEKYPNPYYWGAFICQGNPGPILDKKN